MNGKCAVCGKHLRWTRSRTFCNRHYWRLRRLAEKADWELQRVAEEADHTKRLVAIVIEEQRRAHDVADLQRGGGLPSERED